MSSFEKKTFLSYFIILALFRIIDLITTNIGLSFEGVYETNLIASYLFNYFGNFGYILGLFYLISLNLIFLSAPMILLRLYEVLIQEKASKIFIWINYTIILVFISYSSIMAILNNILIILIKI